MTDQKPRNLRILTDHLFERLRVRTIRSQLTLGIAATLVPCLAIGFYSVQ